MSFLHDEDETYDDDCDVEVALTSLYPSKRQAGTFGKLGPWESIRTCFNKTSFHMLDPNLTSLNPLFLVYREAFEGKSKGLSRLIMNFPLKGQMSPTHTVTLAAESRMQANIPVNAMYYAWCYPFDIEWRYYGQELKDELEKCKCWRCAELMFLIMGGFIYFDDGYQVVSANGLVSIDDQKIADELSKTGLGLKFGEQEPFEVKWINQLTPFDRFKTVSWPWMKSLDNPPVWFAWLRPNEELVAPDRKRKIFGPHGGFVFLFHLDLNERREKLTEWNCYVPVICGKSECCSEKARRMCQSAMVIGSKLHFETELEAKQEDVEAMLKRPTIQVQNDLRLRQVPSHNQKIDIEILRRGSVNPATICESDNLERAVGLVTRVAMVQSKSRLDVEIGSLKWTELLNVSIPNMIWDATEITTNLTPEFAKKLRNISDKVFIYFLASLPEKILMQINLETLLLSDTNASSAIIMRARDVILKSRDHRKRVRQIKSLVEGDQDLKVGLDNFTYRLIEEACANELKCNAEETSIEQRLLFKELIRRFYYFVKPDAQVKAEVEASIKEKNWLRRIYRNTYCTIKSKFQSFIDKDEYGSSSYVAKVVMVFVAFARKIPYFEHGGIADFDIDERVLIKPKHREKPKLAIVKRILDQDFVVKTLEIGEDSKVEELKVEPHRVQRPFKWKCVRCNNDDKAMWRDIYKLKNWVCCLICGLVTVKTLSDIRYNLRNLIKDSTFGGIYYAYDGVKNRDVAIKKSELQFMRIKKRRKTGIKVAEDVENEIKIHVSVCNERKDCSHGILEIYDDYEDPEHSYMVLEWADGGELFEYVNQNFNTGNCELFLKDETAIENWKLEMQQMFYEICLGVKRLHDMDIVHRDLSLENVLLIKNENYIERKIPKLRPCVCDFGLAVKKKERFRGKDTSVGKSRYMSIDCCHGDYDGKANDIWALGVMLTMMVLGAPPYDSFGDMVYDLYKGTTEERKLLFSVYKRDHLVTEEVHEVLAGICKEESERMTIDQVLATKYCDEAPYLDYLD